MEEEKKLWFFVSSYIWTKNLFKFLPEKKKFLHLHTNTIGKGMNAHTLTVISKNSNLCLINHLQKVSCVCQSIK